MNAPLSPFLPVSPSPSLMLHGQWSSENRAALEELVTRKYDAQPIAVFDWDGTCIHGDVSDAVFHALCKALAFRFDLPELWEWFHETRHGEKIRAAYDEYVRAHSDASVQRLRFMLEEARTRMHAHPETDYTAAWAWDAGAFIGWTEEQAREFSRKVIASELARPLETETLALEGHAPIQFARGLRVYQEIRELVAQMQKYHWDVWVISATPRWEVEAFAEQFDIARDHIIAMRRALDGQGRITPVAIPPVSHDIGKWNAYRQFIHATRRPLFVAGDSAADAPLLGNSAEVRLLVNPKNEQLIDYAHVCAANGERWLIQNFDADDSPA